MLIPAKIAGNAVKIALFPICELLNVLESQYCPDANFTALLLFMLKISRTGW